MALPPPPLFTKQPQLSLTGVGHAFFNYLDKSIMLWQQQQPTRLHQPLNYDKKALGFPIAQKGEKTIGLRHCSVHTLITLLHPKVFSITQSTIFLQKPHFAIRYLILQAVSQLFLLLRNFRLCLSYAVVEVERVEKRG